MLLQVLMNLILLWIMYVNADKCYPGCTDCEDNKSCNICEDKYFLKKHGMFSLCVNCPLNCIICSSNTECESCTPEFYGKICDHKCSLCKKEKCDKYGCIKGCKRGYFLKNKTCEECPYRCKKCTAEYTCSICKNGWWGDRCLYSCIPCLQCDTQECELDCREHKSAQCENANSKCPGKCYLHYTWHRLNETVSTTLQTPTTSKTQKLTTRLTTITTTSTKPTRTTSTTPTPIPTTQKPTTSTTATPTLSTTITKITNNPVTTPTTIGTTPRPTIPTKPQPVTRSSIPPSSSTLETSNTFSSPRPTTPHPEEDTETTTQYTVITDNDKNVSPKSQTDGSGTSTLYVVIAVIGLLVLVGVIAIVIYFNRRKRAIRREQVSSSPDTEEYTYAKQNKVRKKDNQAGLSDELDINSEQGLGQSDRVCSNAISHVTETALGIDGIILETCLDESETAATETNNSTGHSMDDDTYYNVLSFQRNKVKVDMFEEYVKSKSTFDFYTEFEKFPKGLSRPHTHAKKPENKIKCRYIGVYPYDTNRVKLQEKANDFINASYIDGYTRQKEYIASLGPTKETMADFVDFWEMVWQDNVEKIVMLTKLVEETKMKCEQYWPDIGEIISYGDVIVTCQSEDVYEDYTTRTLSVTKGQTTRLVHQTHFQSWPDKRVPEKTDVLLALIDNVRPPKSEIEGPIVVHCSAGVGRTGTYIALDILLQQLTEEGAVDVYGCVIGIRGQRVAMVQTLEQYEFIHNVLVESIRKIKSKF